MTKNNPEMFYSKTPSTAEKWYLGFKSFDSRATPETFKTLAIF
jgi:hypothetical protein